MANTIILPRQRVNFSRLTNQFPDPLPPRRKLIFQCELRSLSDGDARFGVIGYPAWRQGANQKWEIGDKVVGVDIDFPPAQPDEIFPVDPPLAFGNIEIPLTRQSGMPISKGIKDEIQEKFFAFLDEYEKKNIESKKKKITLADEFLIFKPNPFPNPHSDYDVTVESNGFEAPSNPSPPADPAEG